MKTICLPWRDGLYLYRVYDAEKSLLYVGATTNLVARIGTHITQASPWIDEADDIRWEFCASNEEMREAEKLAISTEEPLYNQRAGGFKLTQDDVTDIRSSYLTGEKQVALATRYGVKQSTISRVVTERVHKSV